MSLENSVFARNVKPYLNKLLAFLPCFLILIGQIASRNIPIFYAQTKATNTKAKRLLIRSISVKCVSSILKPLDFRARNNLCKALHNPYKQLKQNFPLKYFLGDNENAIKIQIYCALIANLLMTVIQKKLKRSWAFSNLVSFCKIHLFNYIHLINFLENPERDWQKTIKMEEQLMLF